MLNPPDEAMRSGIATGPLPLNSPPLLDDASLEQTFVNTPTKPFRGPATTISERLGRYEIIKKLGEGGMGAVFHARDTATGDEVAIKVLAAGCLSHPDSLRRFEKEARLLEEAKSPHVANLLDVGNEGDTRFLVMEYVRGGDLRSWIRKSGPLDESTSLSIVSDLCRGLVSAHAKGMVHRDIKPENVLLDPGQDARRPLVKLTDFGLARHIDQSESLKLTQTGTLLGTPYYMSPEQFSGKQEISPATDVYSIGATLFELLTGSRPFPVADAIRLAAAHCHEIPPDVRKLNPKLSDATADLVRRMLAKQPGHRPPDSSSVLEEILRIQSGDSSQLLIHPVLPKHDPASLFQADFDWMLASSPASLWPLVSNTDRFNRAADLPPITYETITESDGRIRKFGQFRLAGMKVRWEEHPFEWIEGQRFSVLREFPAGPFKWFMSTVELEPHPDGGTHLKHHVKIEPRNVVGKMLAQLEVRLKGKRNLDRIYRRIDRTISARNSFDGMVDPFQETPSLTRIQRQRLQQRVEEWRKKGISQEILDNFSDLLTNASAQDVSRIQPYALARRFDLPEQQVVDACLYGVPTGLLTLHWDIICPTCRLGTGVKSTLREIERHTNCSACQISFEIEFGSSLELIFRAHPEIRLNDAKTYCAGGPGNFPHVVAQIRLLPSERLSLNLTLDAGSYVLRGPRLPYAIPMEVNTEYGPSHGQIQCDPESNRNPTVILRSGQQNLTIENRFSVEQVIRIERTLHRTDALTAAKATGLPVFRELFPEQTLSAGTLVEMATANFLAIRVSNLDEFLRDLGDAETYLLLNDFRRTFERQIQRHQAIIVDETSDILLASFSNPVSAVEAARELYSTLVKEQSQRNWLLCGSLHRGPALVTGDRNEIKYFGATIHRTLELARSATADSLWLTREIWTDPGISEAFEASLLPIKPESIVLDQPLKQISIKAPHSL